MSCCNISIEKPYHVTFSNVLDELETGNSNTFNTAVTLSDRLGLCLLSKEYLNTFAVCCSHYVKNVG